MIRRFKDLEELSWFGVNYFANLVHPYDRFCVALSGGNTPKRLYELLPTRDDIQWHKIHLFLGDERYVPPSDPHSNELMVREALVQCIDIPLENDHHVYTQEGPQDSADWYEKALHHLFDERDYTFDLALQGVGDDGHTASIFPETANLPEGRWVVVTESPAEPKTRISTTLECLAASKQVVFIVTGESKAARLKEVLAGDDRYPAARLAKMAKNVEWWIDEAAASLLGA